MLEGEHRFDQPGHAGRRIQVAHVGLDRPEGAAADAAGRSAEGPRQGRHFHGVAEGGAGAVRLHIGDAGRVRARHGEGFGDDPGLARVAGRREAQLQAAVVVHGRALDDRAQGVAVTQGLRETLEDDDPRAVPFHASGRGLVKGAAMAVRGGDATLLVQVSCRLGHADGNAAGEGDVALMVEQALARQVDGDQTGRAGRLDDQARPPQVETVGDMGGQIVPLVADGSLERTERLGGLRVRVDVVEEVGIGPGAREHAHAHVMPVGQVAGVLQRRPRVLEEDAELRVHELRFAGREAEQRSVEAIGTP